jgi:hypothetical protein
MFFVGDSLSAGACSGTPLGGAASMFAGSFCFFISILKIKFLQQSGGGGL